MFAFIRRIIDSLRIRKADRCIKKGKFAEGEALFLELSDRSSEAIVKLAQYYHALGLSDKALSLFDHSLDSIKNPCMLQDAVALVKDDGFKTMLANHIIASHTRYLSSHLYNFLCDWIYNAFDLCQSIELFNKIHHLGYDVEVLYVRKVHQAQQEVSNDVWCGYLITLHDLYRTSAQVQEDMLTCAELYQNQKNYDAVIKVTDLILADTDRAKCLHAAALKGLASIEFDLDKKIDLLDSALLILELLSGAMVDDIRESIFLIYHQAARVLYSNGLRKRSCEVLHFLVGKGYKEALYSLAEYRSAEVASLVDAEQKLKAVSDAIEELSQYGQLDSLIPYRCYYDLWNAKANAVVSLSKDLDDYQADLTLEQLVLELKSKVWKSKSDESNICENAVCELIERKYRIAYEKERRADNSAISVYESILSYEGNKESAALYRLNICRLKFSDKLEVLRYYGEINGVLDRTICNFPDLMKDLAYRYVLLLLYDHDDKTSLSIISKFFPSDQHLLDACKHVSLLNAIARLDDFNEKLDLVREAKLSSDETISFIKGLHEYSEVIKPVVEMKGGTLSKYRSRLNAYLIYILFQEGKFADAFERLIKERSDYLDDLDALRNIALLCLNMAESQQITPTNFKEVISVWLTAIYQERLFVKSLDYTAWDNQYDFSLKDAFGHFSEETIGELPENVNFNDFEDGSIVSIKEVQRILLDRFVAAISDNHDYNLFFNEQKDAMDAFCALKLEKVCRIVAPFLSHRDELIFNNIYEALENERRKCQYKSEDILSVGVSYGLSHPAYLRYAQAKECYASCIAAVDSRVYRQVVSSYESSKIDLINEFEKMRGTLISYLSNKVSSLSETAAEDFDANFMLYLPVCQGLRNHTVSFVFSSYVMQNVVREVNGDAMSKSNASTIILSLYKLDATNDRVRDNLTTLFEMLCCESSEENNKAVDEIFKVTKALDFEYFMCLALKHEELTISVKLNKVVQDVNENRISELKALELIYEIYVANPNNDKVCKNLVQISDICIMKYVINQSSGRYGAIKILDLLVDNMSETFKRHSSVLEQSYDRVWNQLSLDAHFNLLYSSYNLNDAGKALNRGLGFYSNLGGFEPATSPGIRLPKNLKF